MPAVLSWIAPGSRQRPAIVHRDPAPVSLMPVTVKADWPCSSTATLPLAPLVFVACQKRFSHRMSHLVKRRAGGGNGRQQPRRTQRVPPSLRDVMPAECDVDRSRSGRDRGVNGDVALTLTVVRLIVSVKVPVTAAPTVNVPELAWRLIALPAVLSWIALEVVVNALPAIPLFTVIPLPVSLMPVTVKGPAVSPSAIPARAMPLASTRVRGVETAHHVRHSTRRARRSRKTVVNNPVVLNVPPVSQ